MEEQKKILGYVKVLVEFDSSLVRFTVPDGMETKLFRRHLLQWLNDLLDGLRIPAEILLSITPQEKNTRLLTSSYRVLVNDRRCRLRLPVRLPDNVQARDLARSVAVEVYRNRDLILSLPLCEKIREAWLSKKSEAGSAGLSGEQFYDFASMLVRRGSSIERGRKLFERLRADSSASCWFEETVSEREATALKLILSSRLPAGVLLPQGDKSFLEMIEMMRDGLFYEMGIILPEVSLDTDETLDDHEFRIQVNDLRFLPVPGLKKDEFLVNETAEKLAQDKITGTYALNPANNNECAIVQETDHALEKCRTAGLTTWGPAEFFVLSLSACGRENAANFLTTEIVTCSMDLLEEAFPTLVAASLDRFDIIALTRVLRDLLEEEVTIRDLRTILESLLAIEGNKLFPATPGQAPDDPDLVDYPSWVRESLRRYISHKYARGANVLSVYLLDPQIESRLSNVDERPLLEEEHDRLIKAILAGVGELPETAQNPVILTTVEIRKVLRNLIEKEFPRLSVLCYQELAPDMNIQPLSRVSW